MNRDTVLWAYRILLNRDPENEEIINYWLQSCSNINQLKSHIYNSEEYRLHNNPISSLNGNEPPIISQLHYHLNENEKEVLFRSVQKDWTEIGNLDPYWGVLSHEEYSHERITPEALDRFYESGFHDVQHILNICLRNKIDIKNIRKVLELGSGTGRISYHLAQKFASVICCDISKSMIDCASNYMQSKNIKNINFLWFKNLVDIENIPRFDLFFSVIVLQHNPPPIISYFLENILTALNNNGIAIFQVPVYLHNYNFTVKAYLENREKFLHDSGQYEVHAIRQPDLYGLLKKHNCELLETYEYNVVGNSTGNQSMMFVVKKLESSNG